MCLYYKCSTLIRVEDRLTYVMSEPTQNPRHNHELHGTNDVLSEDEVEYEDSEDVDFAERAGMTDEEFEEAFANGGDDE